jgi:hypothetical protein
MYPHHHPFPWTSHDNKLNYVDLTITNEHDQLTFGIYQKPTTAALIIHNNNSCHTYEHKKSTINYLINQMNTYHITHKNKNQELETMWEILKTNEYHQQIIHPKQKHQLPTNNTRDTKIKMGPSRIMVPIQEQSQNYSRTLT